MLRRLIATRSGQSLVETALLLPIMLTLAFGVSDAAFAFFAQVQVTNAAREGAQSASQYRYLFRSMYPPNGTYTVAQNDSNRGFGTGIPSPEDYKGNAQTVALASLGSLDPANATVTVTYPEPLDATNNPGRRRQPVQVQVAYAYTLPVSGSFGFFDPTITLRSTTRAMIRNQR